MEQGIFWRNQGILPREQRNSLRKQAIEECGLVGRGENVCVHVEWQSRAAIAREVSLVLGLGMGQRAEAARAIRLAFPPTRRPICASRRLRS